jgi:hypothetical protein
MTTARMKQAMFFISLNGPRFNTEWSLHFMLNLLRNKHYDGILVIVMDIGQRYNHAKSQKEIPVLERFYTEECQNLPAYKKAVQEGHTWIAKHEPAVAKILGR